MTATPDEKAILDERSEHCVRQCCSTEPLDREAATAVIAAVYRSIGKPRPKVLFFSSPLMCLLAGKVLYPVRGQRPAPLWRRIRMQLWNQFNDQLWSHVPKDMDLEVWFEHGVEGRLERLVEGELRRQVVRRLRRRPGGPLLRRLKSQLPSELAGQDGASAELPSGEFGSRMDVLAQELEEWMGAQPPTLVNPFSGELVVFERLEDQREGPLENVCAGPWWRVWLVLHDYLGRTGVSYPPQLRTLLQLWFEQARHCHWWFPYEGIVLASERPCAIRPDGNSRLHSGSEAALEYRDGFSLHAWHGIAVEPHVIVNPAAITVAEVERESNAEVRRVLIERYGWQRYIQDCGAEVADSVPEDHPVQGLRGARLLRKELPGEPEPVVYLDMLNSTPGPDGHARRYLERIDPKAYGGEAGRLCHAAMASRWRYRDEAGELQYTFERWQDYQPTAES
jgi:hypothetical protein